MQLNLEATFALFPILYVPLRTNVFTEQDKIGHLLIFFQACFTEIALSVQSAYKVSQEKMWSGGMNFNFLP